MKTIFVPIIEFLSHGGILTPGRKLYTAGGSYIGTFVGFDQNGCIEFEFKGRTYILADGPETVCVEIEAIPIWK